MTLKQRKLPIQKDNDQPQQKMTLDIQSDLNASDGQQGNCGKSQPVLVKLH
jgi:hypothetical protein